MKTQQLLILGAVAFGVYYYMKNNQSSGGTTNNTIPERTGDQTFGSFGGVRGSHHLRFMEGRALAKSRSHIIV